jgi:hypothetical protein
VEEKSSPFAVIFHRQKLKIKIVLKKKIQDTSYRFSLADGNVDGDPTFPRTGSCVRANARKYYLESLNLHIWRRNDCHLEFFLLVDTKDEIVVQNEKLKNLLLFFLGGRKCGQGVGPRCRWRCRQGQCFDLFLNLHILEQ